MQIKESTDIALRIVMYLGVEGKVCNASEISLQLGVSYPNVLKIANSLKMGGLINSLKGKEGGFEVTSNWKEITMYDILVAMEGEIIIECSGNRHVNDRNKSIDEFYSSLKQDIVAKLRSVKVASFI